MAKLEYKDLPVYIAHADGLSTDESAVNTIINKSVESGTIKGADDALNSAITTAYNKADESVKEWATNKFQVKG